MKNVFAIHVTPTNVVEPKIACFGDDGTDAPSINPHGLAVLKRPINHGIRHARDVESIRDHDRPFDKTHLRDLLGIGDFAETVDAVNCARHLFEKQVASVRDNRGHACANRTFSRYQFACAFDERRVSNAHAGHVGDCVEGTRLKPSDLDAEIARPRSFTQSLTSFPTSCP